MRNRKFRDRRNSPQYPLDTLHHLGYDCYGNVAIAGGVTINNITNVTNVTNVVQANGMNGCWSRKHWKGHYRKPGRNERPERKPELYKFFASCGILDHDKAVRHIDNGTFAGETVQCLGYASRDLSRNVRGIGHGIGQIGHAVGSLIGSVFSLVSDALK